MAQTSLQDKWDKFLNDNVRSWETLNLNIHVISRMRSSGVIKSKDLQNLKAIPEAQNYLRSLEFIEIIRFDVQDVKFTDLVKILRDNGSVTAADLFENFSSDHAADLNTCLNSKKSENGQPEGKNKDVTDSGSNLLQASNQPVASNSSVTNNTYNIYLVSIQNLFLTSSIQWIVDDGGENELPKLFSAAELEASDYGTRGILSCLSNQRPKTGYAMYITCRLNLPDAFKDDERVVKTLESITGNKAFFRENVENLEKLKSHLKAFKNGVPPSADYIIVILSSHGVNDTQMLLDDMKPIDLYHHVVYELDNKMFNQVGVDKPRIYLSNMCRDLNLKAVTEALATVGDEPHITSPYYIVNAGSHGETVRDTSRGSRLLQAFCDVVEKEKHLTLPELALKVEKKIQADDGTEKQNISVDHNLIRNFNPAAFRL